MTSPVPIAVRLRNPSQGTELRPVAPHRVLAELGQGGMANVYLAVTGQQRVFSKLVVLKALKRELAMQPSSLAMFLDEARVAAQLNHPNIVQTHDVGLHQDRHVLVMEYLDGQPLSNLMNALSESGGELPLRPLIRILLSALEGLQYAHDLTSYDGKPLAMVHRDISPHNIFVTYDGHVKVLDFGIAKAATSSTETLTGVIKGKLSYMAPEQLAGEEVDRRADIYSVGCILWALASGQKLWLGLSDAQIVKRVLYGGDIRVPSGFAEREPEFARIVEKCLKRDRNARYQTAAALQHDLERFADRLGPPVRQREVASLVSDLFHESRAEFKRLVQERLQGRSEYVSLAPAALPTKAADDGGATVAEPLAGRRAVADRTAAARPGRSVLASVSVVAVLGAAVFMAFARDLPISSVLRVEPGADASRPSRPSPPPPEHTPVRFAVSPPDAALYLDGTLLPRSTSSIELPRDAALHTLRAEAPGHAPKSVEFVVKDGLVLGLSLTPLVAPSASAQGEAETPAGEALQRGATHHPRRRRSRSDCSNPFFLDGDGIKRVRPECR